MKLKICMLTKDISKDGAAANSFYVCRNLVDMGHEVIVICNQIKGLSDEELKSIRIIKVNSLKLPLLEVISYSKAADNALRQLKENFDIIHAQGSYGFFTFKNHTFNAKYIATNQGLINALEPLYVPSNIKSQIAKYLIFPILKRMDETVYRQSDKVIAISNSIKEEMIHFLGLPASKIVVAYNGINPSEYKTGTGENTKPILLYVGRLVPQKGIEFLIESIKIIKKRTDNFILSIAGSGILENKIKQIIQDYDLTQNVKLIGFIDKPALIDVYSNADVLVVPSLYEPFGLVNIEAMACGIPVVGSNVGGIPEIIDDGKTGLLVQPGNPEELATAITRLLENKELRKKMGAAGRKRAKLYFDWKLITKKILKVYEHA